MKTKELLKEWRSFLNESQSNVSPDWIKKGCKAIYKGKECKVVEPDIRGTQVLISIDNEEKSVSYEELSKSNE